MTRPEKLIATSLLIALWSLSVSALAGALGIWPINPVIEQGSVSTSIWARNSDEAPLLLQVRILRWQQVDGRDVYEPQDELVVSPPMIEVLPEKQQLFRILNRAGAVHTSGPEHSYRILIDEIPRPDSGERQSTLNFQMRYSLPLFVGSTGHQHRQPLLLSYRLLSGSQPQLEIYNHGYIHARLSRVETVIDDSEVLNPGLMGYVLPLSVMRWPLTSEQLVRLSQASAEIRFVQNHHEYVIKRME